MPTPLSSWLALGTQETQQEACIHAVPTGHSAAFFPPDLQTKKPLYSETPKHRWLRTLPRFTANKTQSFLPALRQAKGSLGSDLPSKVSLLGQEIWKVSWGSSLSLSKWSRLISTRIRCARGLRHFLEAGRGGSRPSQAYFTGKASQVTREHRPYQGQRGPWGAS